MFRRKFCYQFHWKISTKSFQTIILIQMFDQEWSVKRSITDVTFERYAVENVSFNSISWQFMAIYFQFMAKNSLLREVIFNKGKQKRGATHFFIRNHASGLVFKFHRGLGCFSSKSFLHSFFFEK